VVSSGCDSNRVHRHSIGRGSVNKFGGEYLERRNKRDDFIAAIHCVFVMSFGVQSHFEDLFLRDLNGLEGIEECFA